MAAPKMHVWSWDANNKAWLQVTGRAISQTRADEQVRRMYRTAREMRINGAAFLAAETGQDPVYSPERIGIEVVATTDPTEVRVPPELLDLIKHHEELLEEARKGLNNAVSEARRRGASWDDVGGALGVSRQAATQRFAVAIGQHGSVIATESQG